MNKAIIYIHGKGGTATEAEHYKTIFPNSTIYGFDYKSETPWQAKKEFSDYYDTVRKEHNDITIIANSIGAFFTMNALYDKDISKAYFISPIVNMEKLISDMMMWANVTGEELKERKLIETTFEETLSWEYLCYVRENPIVWNIPTCILYGEKDNLTSPETMRHFADSIKAPLTVMQGGGHWFHTDEQMSFLDNWILEKSTMFNE